MLILIFLLSGTAAADEEMIVNGDFSRDGYGWTESLSQGNSGSASISYSSNDLTTQDLAVYFTAVTGRDYVYASLSQNVDLTYVDTLTFKLIDIDYETYSNWGGFVVEIGGSNVWERDVNDISTSWQQYSVDVSGYTGTKTVTFKLYLDSVGNAHQFKVGLTDVSAISNAEAPSYIRGTLSSYTTPTASPISVTITANAGYPYTQFYVNWGDGSGDTDISQASGTVTSTLTHSYTTPGTYTIQASTYNNFGSSGTQYVGTVTVVALDFSAYPTSGDPPLTVQFSVSAQNIASLLWDFGDGQTSTVENPIHTYAASTTPYTVTLTGYTTSGDPVVVTKQNFITSSPQSLLFDKSSYEAGETATISWQLRDPDFSSYQYTLQILPSDSLGNTAGSSVITPQSVTSATGTYSWDTTGVTGYYTAVIYRSGSAVPLVFSTTNIITQATLTVNLATNGVTYTNTTTVTASQNGVIIDTQTTSTGQVQFTIPTGTYIISATTTGYATQTATVNLLESTAITIDFVTGTSESPIPSGVGSFYPSTFATFRVLDRTYGTEVSGATITGYAVESTNPVEWLANIYGAAWGSKIIGSEVSAVTDSEGLASFMMFTNVRYTLTLTHPDLLEPSTRTFTLTSLSTEYPWHIDIPHESPQTAANAIKTSVSVSSGGVVNITYDDTSKSTSLVTVTVWEKDDDNNYTIEMDSTTSIGNTNNIQLSLTDYSGADVRITITANTGQFGTVERNYYHTFPGPWFDLGLPAGTYIWICFIVAVLLGGIAPFVNSYACCFVICFVEWIFWSFGWFFEIGQPVAALLLSIATVLSIAYYIASRR